MFTSIKVCASIGKAISEKMCEISEVLIAENSVRYCLELFIIEFLTACGRGADPSHVHSEQLVGEGSGRCHVKGFVDGHVFSIELCKVGNEFLECLVSVGEQVFAIIQDRTILAGDAAGFLEGRGIDIVAGGPVVVIRGSCPEHIQIIVRNRPVLFDVVDESALGIEIVASACGDWGRAAGRAVGRGGFSLGGRFFLVVRSAAGAEKSTDGY